jgi:hypothetical protein
MQGFLHGLRSHTGARRGLATVLFTLAMLASSAAADPASEPAKDASAPGAYCAIGQCRPVSASAWTPAAFAATVVVIGRSARRGAERR